MDLATKLNPKQYEAASSEAQYLRIIAGAGTGKTRTLTYRMAYLLSLGQLKPRQMVAITFTNKAAKEMKERVLNLLATEPGMESLHGEPFVSTFHGFCSRFLHQEIENLHEGFTKNFTIADEDDQNKIFKQIFLKMPLGASKDYTGKVVGKINALKEDGIFPSQVTPSMVPLGSLYTYADLVNVYTQYQDYMRQQNLLDFSDLLLFTMRIMKENEAVRKVWQNRFRIFFVDEFQDTNLVQYELVKLFLKPNDPGTLDGTYLTVVGDPDQTIYTWRGAKSEILQDRLPRDFPTLKTVVLDDNYRSTQSILDVANAVIDHNRGRMKKDLKAASKETGMPVRFTFYGNADSEARDICSKIQSDVRAGKFHYADFALIYRANFLSSTLERQLSLYRIPYRIYGGVKFYQRAEIKDALSYLRILVNPDDVSFLRVLQAPSKGIGPKTVERMQLLESQLGEETNLFKVARTNDARLGFNRGTQAALASFYQAYDRMEEVYLHHHDNDELLSGITEYFERTGFRDYVKNEDKKSAERLSYTEQTSTSKADNVNAFLRQLTEALSSDIPDDEGNLRPSTLEDFLMDVSLESAQDEIQNGDQVSLMTGHVSKGLEFPVVFVTGVNDTLFPSYHAEMGEPGASIDEERRLFYVALTRAKKELFVSSFGGPNFRTGQPYKPSRFVREMGLKEANEAERKGPERPDYYASYGSHRPAGSLFGGTSLSDIQKALARGQKPKSSETYQVGDYVLHTSFGKGKVSEVLPDGKILVDFPEPYGRKKLIVGFKAFRKLNPGEE